MAAGSGESSVDTRTEDLILAIFALLLISNALQSAPRFAQETLGIDVGAPHLVASAALDGDTPMGTEVSTIDGTPYYAGANGQTEIGTFAPGTGLAVVGGPQAIFGGARWWEVKDRASGVTGWVPERALVREGVGGFELGAAAGMKVRAIADVTLREGPGAVTSAGQVVKGTYGRLAAGPTEERGTDWWLFASDEGDVEGWLPEAALVFASDRPWQVGSRVKATYAVDLFSRAGGGAVLGAVSQDEELAIVSGPVRIGGVEYWWLVETGNGTQGWVSERALAEGGPSGWFKGVMATVLIIAIIFSLLLVSGVVYAVMRTNQIRARETKRIRDAIPKALPPLRNERWERVLTHVNSSNPNDWRIAIIEADVMLDELVLRLGYSGNTLGERLKQAVRGDFKTVDLAWEAHRVRNEIAHAGSDFVLTEREAKRVIDLYERVFEEFKFS